MTVNGSMFCCDGFAADGQVRLLGARISGQLNCDGGAFVNPGGNAIVLDHADVAETICLRPAALTGGISLLFARAGAWHDSATTWPAEGQLRISGFRYKAIQTDPKVATKRRLEWLRRDSAEGFVPQPYEQLGAVYRHDGNEREARKVQICAQWRRRAARGDSRTDKVFRPVRVAWSALLLATIGYGYRPWQILSPIGFLFGFGSWWFGRAEQHGQIVPVNNQNPGVEFNAARYTVDLLIPGASLGERVRFLPVDAAAWWATGYTLVGWAMAAMLIAGLTGVFKRQ
jgi:hypothetical protein